VKTAPVTVLLAAHNAQSTVERAIESVRAQTYTDWRLLLVNDGSSDGTGRIFSHFEGADDRVSAISIPQKSGLATALNTGLAQSRSALIARMDADDLCFPDRLAKQMAYMEDNPETDVLGSAAHCLEEHGGGTAPRLLIYPEEHRELARNIYHRNPFIHPSVIYRRAFIERFQGYDCRFQRAQDYDLWLRSYRFAHFHNLPIPLIQYRVRPRTRWRDVRWGLYAIWLALGRERKRAAGGWYLCRPILAYSMSRFSRN
jgi:glycosyltransferase involved in cell wall biosynthesis